MGLLDNLVMKIGGKDPNNQVKGISVDDKGNINTKVKHSIIGAGLDIKTYTSHAITSVPSGAEQERASEEEGSFVIERLIFGTHLRNDDSPRRLGIKIERKDADGNLKPMKCLNLTKWPNTEDFLFDEGFTSEHWLHLYPEFDEGFGSESDLFNFSIRTEGGINEGGTAFLTLKNPIICPFGFKITITSLESTERAYSLHLEYKPI